MTAPARTVDYEEWSQMPRLRDVVRIRVGDLVVIRSRGAMRLARVTKVGTARVHTEYTTESALRAAEKDGLPVTITRKPVRIDDDFIRYAGRPA